MESKEGESLKLFSAGARNAIVSGFSEALEAREARKEKDFTAKLQVCRTCVPVLQHRGRKPDSFLYLPMRSCKRAGNRLCRRLSTAS
jgi:hypothetical protein